MISYLKFKKSYPNSSYKKYFMDNIKYNFKKFIRIPYCCYMCIKYPFLYPRNRFSDLHYNNWKIQNLKGKIIGKYLKSELHLDMELEKFQEYFRNFDKTNKYWVNNPKGSRMITWWTNWWSKPIVSFLEFYHDHILQIFHCLPTYTEWDCMEKGWKKAFGKQYLDELKEAAIKDGYLKSLRIMQLKEKWGCYDETTEVLTKNGWKLFSNVTYEDEIATLNPITQYMEYHKPTDIIAYRYTGPMYRLENRGVSLNVTPNHNLYVSKGSYFYAKKGNLKVTYSFELCTPDKYFGKDKRFLKGCRWEGIQPEEYFQIPDYTYVQEYEDKHKGHIKRTYIKSGSKIEIKAFLKFLGFYIAEGSTNIKEGKNGAHISVAFNPIDETELVKTLIKDIGFNCKIYKGGNSARFSNIPLGHWLREHCGHKAPNKKVPDFIKHLSPEYIKIFLKYLYIGDGYKDKTSWKLTTTSKQLRDDVCELILKCGQTFRFYTFQPHPSFNSVTGRAINSKLEHYDINWMKNIELEIDNSKSKKSKSFVETWENYDGMVYCVTVPHHIIYIRRNGKGVWCGNSCQLYLNMYGDNVFKVIQKYEDLSWNTCIKCGKPATHTSKGWISPYCEDCINKDTPDRYIKRSDENKDGYTEDMIF